MGSPGTPRALPADREDAAAADRAKLTTELCEGLSRPRSYPGQPTEVQVRESHISWVFLAGDRAYKLKKPVVLDFVDYRTAERRRAMCEAEVWLNRRLAPDLYLGVRGLVMHDGTIEMTEAGDPRAVDYVVEMRRYDESRTMAALLRRGELERRQVQAVGMALARFHAGARRVEGARAPVLAAEWRFEQNLHELLGWVEQRGEIGRAQALERFAHAFITAHERTFRTRAAAGRLREGHGDLRAEHVLIDGTVRVVDCLEFDRGLRELDVADDLAFLVFDLVARGGERFADELVRAYRGAGGDPGHDALIAFYAAYRALVRAKVALVRAAQLPGHSAEHGQASAAARELIAVAERFAWRARAPLVLVVCGLPASGKSSLARALAERARLPHLSADRTRKQLAGLRPGERASPDLYTAEWNTRTYGELGRRAAQAVTIDGGAIVDGTFRHLSDRRAFSSTFGLAAPVEFIECQAPATVLVERAARRADDPGRVSDADAAVVRSELGSWDPLDEVPADAHLALRTDRPLEQVVGDVDAVLDRRLEHRGGTAT